ncbi:MAG: hypothetical protein ACM3WU_06220 [Bacillota bacterium]
MTIIDSGSMLPTFAAKLTETGCCSCATEYYGFNDTDIDTEEV